MTLDMTSSTLRYDPNPGILLSHKPKHFEAQASHKKENEMSTNNQTQKRTIPFGGIMLILVGCFILLEQIFDFDMTGGVFFAALGLIFILWGATQRKAGLLIPGGILTGLSAGIFLVEDTQTIAEPYEGGAFLLALAAGFALITLLTHLFTIEKHWWAAIVAVVLATVGGGVIILEMPNAEPLKQAVETIFTGLQYIWPLALIGLGLWIILKRRQA